MTRTPGDVLLHPVAWGGMLVLVVNDHWGKATFHNWTTGMLSDLAGLAFFPLVMLAVVEVVRAWRKRGAVTTSHVLACVIATGLVFSLVETWPPASWAYELSLSLGQWPVRALSALTHGRALPGLHAVAHVADVEDLLALPALVLPLWVGLARVADVRDVRAGRVLRVASSSSTTGA
jgi:hypothetical protein